MHWTGKTSWKGFCWENIFGENFIGSAHVKVWIGLDISPSDDFCQRKRDGPDGNFKQLSVSCPKLRYFGENRNIARRLWNTHTPSVRTWLAKLWSFGFRPNDWPQEKLIIGIQEKTMDPKLWHFCWYNFDPQVYLLYGNGENIAIFPCVKVLQSNWNCHSAGCFWSFWWYSPRRVLKSRTSKRVLPKQIVQDQVFKSDFLDEMDPAYSSPASLWLRVGSPDIFEVKIQKKNRQPKLQADIFHKLLAGP